MKLPSPRGPVSTVLIATLGGSARHLEPTLADRFAGSGKEALVDEDLQLTLFVLYELAYRGWDGVDDQWEWQPDLIRLRTAAEDRFERALRALTASSGDAVPDDLSAATLRLSGSAGRPSRDRRQHLRPVSR
jgi:hypothetical protein